MHAFIISRSNWPCFHEIFLIYLLPDLHDFLVYYSSVFTFELFIRNRQMHHWHYYHVPGFHLLSPLPLVTNTDHPGSRKLQALTQSSQVLLCYLLMHTIISALESRQILIFVYSYSSQKTTRTSDLVPARYPSFERRWTLFILPSPLIQDLQSESLVIFPIIMENFY